MQIRSSLSFFIHLSISWSLRSSSWAPFIFSGMYVIQPVFLCLSYVTWHLLVPSILLSMARCHCVWRNNAWLSITIYMAFPLSIHQLTWLIPYIHYCVYCHGHGNSGTIFCMPVSFYLGYKYSVGYPNQFSDWAGVGGGMPTLFHIGLVLTYILDKGAEKFILLHILEEWTVIYYLCGVFWS